MQLKIKLLSLICGIFVILSSFLVAIPISADDEEGEGGIETQDNGGTFEDFNSYLSYNFSFSSPSYSNYSFNQSNVTGSFCRATMTGTSSIDIPGFPIIPFDTKKILIPFGKEIDSIEVILKAEKEDFVPDYLVEPGRGKFFYGPNGRGLYPSDFVYDPFSSSTVDEQYQKYVARNCDCIDCDLFFNASIYGSNSFYPVDDFELYPVQRIRGFNVVDLNLYPIRYNPKASLNQEDGVMGKIQINPDGTIVGGEIDNGGILRFSSFLDLKINLKDAENVSLENFRGIDSDFDYIADLVYNDEVIDTYMNINTDGEINDNGGENGDLSGLSIPESGVYPYVIITNNDLKNYEGDFDFYRLLDHSLSQRNLPGCIVSVEDIYDEFPGYDDPCRVRSFIKFAYENWDTEYVLIGGDDDVVPVRKYDDINTGGYGDVPSDLYYACLDGDGPGSVIDDLTAEVLVGRAPVGTPQEVSNFVKKTISYELTTESENEYLNKALWLGEYLFGPERGCDTLTWGKDSKEEMIVGSNANGYSTVGIPVEGEFAFEVDTLYEKDLGGKNSWGKYDLISRIDDGVHIMNHLGHGNPTNAMKMSTLDVHSLDNDEYFFLYSQTCLAGRFTTDDCFAEYLTVKTDNAAFAVIMNTCVGVGACGSTNGPSQHFDRQFWDSLFGYDAVESIGHAHFLSKEKNLGRINQPHIRLVYYESTLFGDPAVSMKRTPGERVCGDVDNNPPSKPEPLSPLDGITGVPPEHRGIPLRLSVNVFDLNRDKMDVFFYDASDDSLIWADYGVKSGSIASVPWWGLEYGKTYSWYVVVDDSNYQPEGRNGTEFTNTSKVFSFSTIDDPSLPAESWWDDDWMYRSPIFVANYDSEDREDVGSDGEFRIEILVNRKSGMQSDFDDIRFVKYDDDSTVFNYWLSEVKDDSAVFHVKLVDTFVPDNTPRACIWMYYGNDNAVNCSDVSWFANEEGLSLDWSMVAPSNRLHNMPGSTITPRGVITDSEGNVIIANQRGISSFISSFPISWIITKLDPTGELLWEKELGESWPGREIAFFDYQLCWPGKTGILTNLKDMTIDSQDNIILVGGGMPLIFKLSSSGEILWYSGSGGLKKPPKPAEKGDSCCFPAGTMISMADHSLKTIEDVVEGDMVLSYDLDNKSYVSSKVTSLIVKDRDGVYEINQGLLSPTDDHPVYVCKSDGRKGWASIDPSKSSVAYTDKEFMQLEIGDKVFTKEGLVEIESISYKPGFLKTYTFSVEYYHCYFADGVLVSNAPGCEQEPEIPGAPEEGDCSKCNPPTQYDTSQVAVDSEGYIAVTVTVEKSPWPTPFYGEDLVMVFTPDGLCLTPNIYELLFLEDVPLDPAMSSWENMDYYYIYPWGGNKDTPIKRGNENVHGYFSDDVMRDWYEDKSFHGIPIKDRSNPLLSVSTGHGGGTGWVSGITSMGFDSNSNLVVGGTDYGGDYQGDNPSRTCMWKFDDFRDASMKVLPPISSESGYIADDSVLQSSESFIDYLEKLGRYYNLSDYLSYNSSDVNESLEDLNFSGPVFWIKNDGQLPIYNVTFNFSPLNMSGNYLFESVNRPKLLAKNLVLVNDTKFVFNGVEAEDLGLINQSFSSSIYEGCIGKIDKGERIGIGFETNLKADLIKTVLQNYEENGLWYNTEESFDYNNRRLGRDGEKFGYGYGVPWYGGMFLFNEEDDEKIGLGIRIANVDVNATAKENENLGAYHYSSIYTVLNDHLKRKEGDPIPSDYHKDPPFVNPGTYYEPPDVPCYYGYTSSGLLPKWFRLDIDPLKGKVSDFVFNEEDDIIANVGRNYHSGGLMRFNSSGRVESSVRENEKPYPIIDQTFEQGVHPFKNGYRIPIDTQGGGVYNLSAYSSYDVDGEIVEYRWYKGYIEDVENWPPHPGPGYCLETLIGTGPELTYSTSFEQNEGPSGVVTGLYIRLEVMDNNGELDPIGSLKLRHPFTYAYRWSGFHGEDSKNDRNIIQAFSYMPGVVNMETGEYQNYIRKYKPPEIYVYSDKSNDISGSNGISGVASDSDQVYVTKQNDVILRGIFDGLDEELRGHGLPLYLGNITDYLEAVWTIERVDDNYFEKRDEGGIGDRGSNFSSNFSSNKTITYIVSGNGSSNICNIPEDAMSITIIDPSIESISTVGVNFSDMGMYDVGLKYRWKNFSWLPYPDNNPFIDVLFPYFITSRELSTRTIIVDEPGPNPPVADPGSVFANDFGNTGNVYMGVLGVNMTFDGYYHGRTYDPDGGYIIPPMEWDFGDGKGESWRPMPRHEYETAGNYVVNQTVRDVSGEVSSASVTNQISRWVGGNRMFATIYGEESYTRWSLDRADDGHLYVQSNFRISEIDQNFTVVDAVVDQVFDDWGGCGGDDFGQRYSMAVHNDGIFKEVYALGYRGGPYGSNEWEDGGIYLAKYNYYDLDSEQGKSFVSEDVYTPSGNVNHPVIRLSSDRFDFGDVEQDSIVNCSFEIYNIGTDTLEYSLSESCSWLSINPVSGTSTGEHDTINVTVDTTGLSLGDYSYNIDISSNDVSKTFNINLNVVEILSPRLAIDPSGFDFGWILDDQIDSTSFNVWNSGIGVLDYSLSESCSWLSVNPTEGTSSGEIGTIEVNIDTTGLADGVYSYDIDIVSDNGTDVFAVSLTVVSGPILSVSPESYDLGILDAGVSVNTSFVMF